MNIKNEFNAMLGDKEKLESIKSLPITHCGDGVYMRIVENAEKSDFDEYASTLKNEGLDVCVSSICENEFLSAVSGEGYIYAMYVPCRREIRLLFTEKGELIPERLGDKESYVGEKTLTQLAPNDEAKNFGMCYIFSLGEGHFLIYDGLGSAGEDEVKLYDVLRSATPEGQKPVVDAWILTHPHYDHIAGVHKFALRYKDETEVRNFVMNMRDAYNFPVWRFGEFCACYSKWLPELFAAYPEAKVYKAHTGQVFSVGDARVEILYTQEECFDALPGINDTSIVSRVFISGKTLIFTADITGPEECQRIHDMYGAYLKSDYYQLAHHAWDTDVLRFYYDIDPEHMLWPLRARDWDRTTMWTFPATKVYVEEMNAGKRQWHIARGENIVLPL